MAPKQKTISDEPRVVIEKTNEKKIARAMIISRMRTIIYVLAAFVVVLLLGSGYLGWQLYSVKKSQPQLPIDQTKDIISKVSKLIVLPDEIPVIATVNDLNALKGQSFFENAQVGDKVLIFMKAQKAILYDPVNNRIINVAPVSDTQPNSQSTPQPTPQPSPKK